jgi:hypothetical protein
VLLDLTDPTRAVLAAVAAQPAFGGLLPAHAAHPPSGGYGGTVGGGGGGGGGGDGSGGGNGGAAAAAATTTQDWQWAVGDGPLTPQCAPGTGLLWPRVHIDAARRNALARALAGSLGQMRR